jgi:acetyl esterase/lipase
MRLLKHGLASFGETLWRRARGRPYVERWPFAFEVLWGMTRRNLFASRELSPRELRRRQEEMAREPDLPLTRRTETIGEVDVEWFVPPKASSEPGDPLIVYLHGGGYVFGSPSTHASMIGRLATEAGVAALGIDYALAPEHDVGEARDDVVDVWQSLLAAGWQPERMAMAGDSAGGGLSLSTCVALRERDLPQPARLVLLSPWVDLQCDTPSYETYSDVDLGTAEMFREMARVASGDRAFDDPVLSPLHADLSGVPPTLIQVGGLEMIIDDCRRLGERLEAADVEVDWKAWPEMIHGFHMFDRVLPEADEAIAEAAAFLDAIESDPVEDWSER